MKITFSYLNFKTSHIIIYLSLVTTLKSPLPFGPHIKYNIKAIQQIVIDMLIVTMS